MAKIKVTLERNPTFPGVVAIPVPGSTPDMIPFTFKYRTRDEFIKAMTEIKDMTNAEAVMHVATAWGLPNAEFNLENIQALDQLYLGSVQAILDTYIAEVTQVKTKN